MSLFFVRKLWIIIFVFMLFLKIIIHNEGLYWIGLLCLGGDIDRRSIPERSRS